MSEHCCDEVAIHGHDGVTYLRGKPYRYRHAFHWRRPFAHVYVAAVRRRFAVNLNRYPGVVIGVAFQVGRRVLSVVWGRPGRTIEIPTHPDTRGAA